MSNCFEISKKQLETEKGMAVAKMTSSIIKQPPKTTENKNRSRNTFELIFQKYEDYMVCLV